MNINEVSQDELATIDGGTTTHGIAYEITKFFAEATYLGAALYMVATFGGSTGPDGY